MDNKTFTLQTRAITGLVLILFGILITLDNFHVVNAAAYLRYWPVLLVLLGGLKAVKPGGTGGRIIGGTLAAIGLFMLLDRADILHVQIWKFWPLLLVMLGLSFVFRTSRSRVSRDELDSDVLHGNAVLGGMQQKNTSSHFSGGRVSAILGGYEIDLRSADMMDGSEAVLDVFALLGGVEIRVPDTWTVIVDGNAILGGIENKTSAISDKGKVLRISGHAVLGGVEIRN